MHRFKPGLLARIALLAGAFLLAACDMPGAGGRESPSPVTERTVPALPVETMTVFRGDIEQTYRTVTTLEAGNTVDVVARSTGVLEKLLVEEGDRVEAGQTLAQLDTAQLVLEVAQREATVARLRGDLERAQAIFDRQLGTSQNVETANFEYKAQLAQLELSQLLLDYATVTAPISGIVTQRLVNQGNMVQANNVLFTLVDQDSMEAVLNLPQKELSRVAVGQAVTLQVDAWPEHNIPGQIRRVRPQVDADTGTFRVVAALDNSSRLLQAGMFGRVEIILGVRTDALLIEEQALITRDDRAFVYVVRDNVAVLTFVQPGIRQNGLVEIIAGLQAGDLVITTGQQMLEDGAIVEVIKG
ncbi:MAG: efflux RND transporter periplasmic adaptor subunit [Pseudomonadales bacterium]|nr:efflux RND transporter periplasmic adaptor subunit [Pseudomonadales bacterium]